MESKQEIEGAQARVWVLLNPIWTFIQNKFCMCWLAMIARVTQVLISGMVTPEGRALFFFLSFQFEIKATIHSQGKDGMLLVYLINLTIFRTIFLITKSTDTFQRLKSFLNIDEHYQDTSLCCESRSPGRGIMRIKNYITSNLTHCATIM